MLGDAKTHGKELPFSCLSCNAQKVATMEEKDDSRALSLILQRAVMVMEEGYEAGQRTALVDQLLFSWSSAAQLNLLHESGLLRKAQLKVSDLQKNLLPKS